MTENDYNAIKPTPTLPSITGLNPAQGSEGRSKKRNAGKRSLPKAGSVEDGLSRPTAETMNTNLSENDIDKHCIDYCA